jgi:hypothetical protein
MGWLKFRRGGEELGDDPANISIRLWGSDPTLVNVYFETI